MIYFLYGKNDFFSFQKLKEIQKKISEQFPDLRVEKWNKEKNWNILKIKEVLSRQGLFQQKQLIVFKNYFQETSLEEQKELKIFFNLKKDINLLSDIFLIFWENGSVSKSNPLVNFLLRNAKTLELKDFTNAEIKQWIIKKFKIQKISIDQKGLQELVINFGRNLWELNNEIDKLINFALENRQRTLKRSDIKLITRKKNIDNIFKVIESLSSGKKQEALNLLHQQLDFGDDPLKILSMYVYQYRILLKIADYYFQGIRNKNLIVQETKLHPFVVQKGIWNLRNFSSQKELKTFYKKLSEVDYRIKTGQIDPELALDLLLSNI